MKFRDYKKGNDIHNINGNNMSNAAAVILCAGKGTRMNDDSKNKVCFDCAGIPVIQRIISNMRIAGVEKFVIVIGHQAYSVMDCLDGIDGVIYAYQKEQKGTGHAALCGLKALSSIGYEGPVIVSMGDKIIAPDVISDLLKQIDASKSIWCVQPLEDNFNGGRVVVNNGKPLGIVEFADAALMALANENPENYEQALQKIGLNPKKWDKVVHAAKSHKTSYTRTICGTSFSADEILHSPYSNAGLYCFDIYKAMQVFSELGSNNAQGEIYLTDALELFANQDEASFYEIKNKASMQTYSTKAELKNISLNFMRNASEVINSIKSGYMNQFFIDNYRDTSEQHKQRYINTIQKFITKYGDKKIAISRAPGRINLMGRHIDHRGGGINIISTEADTVFVVSPRKDDIVQLSNLNEIYPDRSFSIKNTLAIAPHEDWLSYLSNRKVIEALEATAGDWSNYVKAAFLRVQLESDTELCGMDIVANGSIPPAAGLSSSSSIVVATMEAVVALNCLNLADNDFISLCGEAEWFVGSRGGAGDHAAIKCGKKDSVLHIGFKPFEIGNAAKIPDKYAVIVANSMLKAKKSEGSKDKFNSKIAAYEFSFMLIKKMFPEYDFREFRDISKVRPYSKIYEILKAIPETITRGSIKALLPEYKEKIESVFIAHSDPGIYELRGVALFGISECLRSEKCIELLKNGDFFALGKMMKISHNGDRITDLRITDNYLDSLIASNADPSMQSGAYGCSLKQIDGLCDLLDATDGVLGSQIAGAGLGGCIMALVEKSKSESIIEIVNKEYYDKYGYEHSAHTYLASNGSSIVF